MELRAMALAPAQGKFLHFAHKTSVILAHCNMLFAVVGPDVLEPCHEITLGVAALGWPDPLHVGVLEDAGVVRIPTTSTPKH